MCVRAVCARACFSILIRSSCFRCYRRVVVFFMNRFLDRVVRFPVLKSVLGAMLILTSFLLPLGVEEGGLYPNESRCVSRQGRESSSSLRSRVSRVRWTKVLIVVLALLWGLCIAQTTRWGARCPVVFGGGGLLCTCLHVSRGRS